MILPPTSFAKSHDNEYSHAAPVSSSSADILDSEPHVLILSLITSIWSPRILEEGRSGGGRERAGGGGGGGRRGRGGGSGAGGRKRIGNTQSARQNGRDRRRLHS